MGIAATPFILFAIVTLLLYLPPVQRWAVGIATHYASEATGMQISIDDVHLRFPLDLTLGGVKAIKQNDSLPQVRDTIIDARRAICEVQLRPLFDKQVEVNILQLDSVCLNTNGFISDCRVKGRVGQLMVVSHGINLRGDSLNINKAYLSDADLDICLSDTAQEDTTTTEQTWVIALQQLDIERSHVMLHLPGDTLNVAATLQKASARNGLFDLRNSAYHVEHLDINNSQLAYDDRFAVKEPKYLDYNHIAVSDLNLGVDSLSYVSHPDSTWNVALAVRSCYAKEKCGLAIASLTGQVRLDTMAVDVTDLALKTRKSDIRGNIHLDYNAFDDVAPGTLLTTVNATLAKEDLKYIIGDVVPKDIMAYFPDEGSHVYGTVSGNLKRLKLDDLKLRIPTLLSGTATATLQHLDNPDNLIADVRLNISDMGKSSAGHVSGTVHYGMRDESYAADLNIRNLNISRYAPGSGLGIFSGTIKAKGHGTDIYSKHTVATAYVKVGNFRCEQFCLNGTTAHVDLRNGHAQARLHTPTGAMNTDLTLDALMSRNKVRATVSGDVHNLDFYALKLAPQPLKTSLTADLLIDTDLKDNYIVKGTVDNFQLTDSADVYQAANLYLDLFARRDTTHIEAKSGDFMLNADFSQGYSKLISLGSTLADEVTRQIDQRQIDESAVRRKLPNGHLVMHSGCNNPVALFISKYGYNAAELDADVATSSTDGINGTIVIDTLRTDGLQLDHVNLTMQSDAETMGYQLNIVNGPDNPQYAFSADASGKLTNNGTTLALKLDDVNQHRLLDISMAAAVEQDDIRITIDKGQITIGKQTFNVGERNWLTVNKQMRIGADLLLASADGTGLQIYSDSTATDDDTLQDLTVTVNKLNIAEILSVLPYMPDVSGIADGDFHVVISPDDTTIAADVSIADLAYEGCQIGNISADLTYMPHSDGSHHIDGMLYKDGEQVADIKGTYQQRDDADDIIDAQLVMDEMPMTLVNGFIPDQIVGFDGTASGTLNVEGAVTHPDINGTANLSKARLLSVPYGVVLTMDETPVSINASRIEFRDFHFYDTHQTPLTVNGYFDFSDFDHMNTSLTLSGKNLLVVDAKESRRSEAYGKMYVNFIGRVQGEVSSLSMRAKLDVLPTTNLYYILRDSPLTTDNHLNELVTFTDFRDETQPTVTLPSVSGINIDMNISVMEGSHVTCWLNTNHTNFLDVVGSGDLRFRYQKGTMAMTGRYTISDGEMKYSLPVIPLKTFTISKDSYIEFTGDVMNPKLAITATENVRTTVNADGSNTPVNFTCGIVISKTLNDMGLQFIISADDNSTVSDQLSMMSVEERGKIAVTMLTTGMYLTDDNSSNITMNSALSAFLQSQINNIAGSALRTLDLSVGLENTMTSAGTFRTDYSYKFAKRFWNNRISVSLGGRISTGAEAAGRTASVFDNVEVSYRLSDTSNQYLRLFYKHDVYDQLEGYLDQFGAGYMYKRKFQTFKELFYPSSTTTIPVKKENNDTIQKTR